MEEVNKIFLKLMSFVAIYNKEDIDIVIKAFNMAYDNHKGQYRASGEPYIIHPLNVALSLAKMYAPANTVCAGLLHDIVEDTRITTDDLKLLFNDRIAFLVDAVSKVTTAEIQSKKMINDLTTHKLLSAIPNDLSVLYIKLADRLHNMKTLDFKCEEKQIITAKQTMGLYVPLAGLVGAYKIRRELADLCFCYTKKEEYKRLSEELEKIKEGTYDLLIDMQDNIKSHLTVNGVESNMEIRFKNIFQVYTKLGENLRYNEIYDLLGIKVLVDTKPECYQTLGIIHSLYKPDNSKIKDYIASPKENLYSSLNSSVIPSTLNDYGFNVHIRIATEYLDLLGSYGLAGYWKEEKSNGNKIMVDRLSKIRPAFYEYLVSGAMFRDVNKYMLSLEQDFLTDQIYVYTPKGDVINLPVGSTVVDFAFHIHSNIAAYMCGAKVNGVSVSIATRLNNNDIVEIIKSKEFNQLGDLYDLCRTDKAKRENLRILKKANQIH